MDEDVVTSSGIVVPATALHWRFSASSGSGGQHVNRTASKAQLTVTTAELLGSPDRLQRVLENLGPVVRVSAQASRSQWRNRQLCVQRLVEVLDGALVEEAERRPTRVPRAARERRLNDKRRESERKRQRRSFDD